MVGGYVIPPYNQYILDRVKIGDSGPYHCPGSHNYFKEVVKSKKPLYLTIPTPVDTPDFNFGTQEFFIMEFIENDLVVATYTARLVNNITMNFTVSSLSDDTIVLEVKMEQ